jgi:transcriptional regulator GlxA family with amidase domain
LPNRIFFYISNHIHILDLAGPVQVFYESGEYGIPYEVMYISDEKEKEFSAGLRVDKLVHFSEVSLVKDDILIIPGFSIKSNTQMNAGFIKWLRDAHARQTTICSICTGIFALAKANLLNGVECTTHWKYTDTLQKQFPALKVQKNRLFIKSGNIYTSAGITTGIDLALSLIEERHGAKFAYQLAKELVAYIRRDSADTQESVFIQYRQHINYQVHEVQDWIIHHLHLKIAITDLAEKVNMSPRNLTRLFKAKTGITIGDYIEKLKVEKALRLLKQKEKVVSVALECGFKNSNQLIHLLKKHTGQMPKQLLRSQE